MRKETLLPLLSGALTGVAMPGTGMFPLIFVSLIPWFATLKRGHGFRTGLLFGIALFAVDLRWILSLDRFNILVIPGWFVLVALFALPFAVLGMLAVRCAPRDGIARWVILLPALFVLAEFLRMYGPLGMGFSTIYLALYRVPWLIQSASVFGPWLISAVIVAINGALYLALRRRSVRFLVSAVCLVGFLAAFSLLPVHEAAEDPLRVAVVSSQVLQEEKLDGRNLEILAERYLGLGTEAIASSPDLAVFPESILPAYILQDSRVLPRFEQLARDGECRILLGTGVYHDNEIYNTVASFAPTGELLETYEMMRPVPFGEYVPGRALLEKLGFGSMIRGLLPMDLSRGAGYTVLDGIGTPICFESTFPTAARQFALAGAELLAVVTNDAWFAGNSELAAHFAATLFRAVETRRWTLQAANGGISGIITPRGRIVASQRAEGVILGEVQLYQGLSIYARWGDLALVLASGFCVLACIMWRFVWMRRKGTGDRVL